MIPAGDTGIAWPSLKERTRPHGTRTARRTPYRRCQPYAHGDYADSGTDISSLRTACGPRWLFALRHSIRINGRNF